jgi:exosortase A
MPLTDSPDAVPLLEPIQSHDAVRRGWLRAGVVLGLSWLLTAIIFHKTLGFFRDAWLTNTYSYGFLILPLAGYLVWISRDRLAHLQVSPTLWPALPLLGCAFVWLVANLAHSRLGQELALLSALVLIAWAVIGTQAALALRFPLAYLFLAVPAGDSLIPLLQDFAAQFAIAALHLIGVPALLEGRRIQVPSGFWEVAAACSGLRFLIASLAIGILFAGLVYRSWWRRILFLLASLVVPILANGIRVFGIILVGHLTNNRVAVGVDHLVYGWLFSTLVAALLFSIGWRWREDPARAEGPASNGGRVQNLEAASGQAGILKCGIVAAVCLGTAAMGPLASQYLSRHASAVDVPVLRLPSVALPWGLKPGPVGRWSPVSSGATTEISGTFSDGRRQVRLHFAYYAPDALEDAANSANSLFDGKRWTRLSDAAALANVDGRPLRVRETLLLSDTATKVVWSWYCADRTSTSSAYRLKFRETRAKLARRRPPTLWITLAADFAPEKADATAALQAFLDHASFEVAANQACQAR